MAHYHRVRGGGWVSTERWLDVLHTAGFQCEIHPDIEAPLERVQAELAVRFGHDVLGEDDFLLWMDVERHLPPPDAPPSAVERYRVRLRRLRELNAPPSLVLHAAIIVAAFDEGPTGVIAALLAHRADADPADHASLDAQIAACERSDATLEQEWLLRILGGGVSEVALLAGWALSAAFAEAAGGELAEAATPFGEANVAPELARIRQDLRSFDVEPPGTPVARFEGWESVELDDDG